MSDNLREQIYKSLIVEETEDLLDIWQFGNIDDWDEIVFEIIKEILSDRLGYVPPQSIEFQISEILYRVEDYLEYNELEKALRECELAIELNPDFAIPYNYRGEIYEEMGQLENAIVNYQKAIELDPHFKDAWENILRVEATLEEEFEVSNTKKHLDQALEYANNGETEKALAECETAKLTLPNIASAYNYLGLIFDTLDMLGPAINSYRTAIQLNPESKGVWGNFLSIELALEEEFEGSIAKQHLDQSLAYASDGETEKALAECEIAKPLMPSLAIAYNYLGLIFQTLNQLEPAIDSYVKAVQLNPRFYVARENLADARLAWEEEQYHLVTDLSPGDIQAANTVFDESKIKVSNEPIPQWLYMDERAFLLVGWAGHRTRQGRSGYDPLDSEFEFPHVLGVIIRELFDGKYRTNNPIHLFLMICSGFMFCSPLIVLTAITQLDLNIILNTFLYVSTTSLYWLTGIALITNVILSMQPGSQNRDDA
jgi:Tfp pilus assembly protein PilF